MASRIGLVCLAMGNRVFFNSLSPNHIHFGIGNNPIHGCWVKMAPDIKPIYAGLNSKNVLYVDVVLL